MKSINKAILGITALSILFVVSSCKDDATPSPVKITDPPSDVVLEFTSNSTANLTFVKTATTQNKFNVQLTDQYENIVTVDGVTESPAMLSGIPKGQIYKIQMAAGKDDKMGEYGEMSEVMLASANEDVNMDRIKMYNLINEARSEARVCGSENMPATHPLYWDDKLEEAARVHTVDMHTNNFFSHNSPTDNSDPGQRINNAGYTWSTYGENIASGQTSEEQVMESWLNSPGHCSNIMSEKVIEMGLYREGDKWTQVFGKPK